ncbi:MAG: CADD family putative folate metabolism protein [Caulobacterales bacterium]|jgi:pyrroloquinoline-quinone synthase
MADGSHTLRTSQSIDMAVSQRAMLSHAFYRAWTEGKLSLDTLQEYAKQYFHHVEQFPRVVSAVHSQCPDAQGRKMLAENLAEEEGLNGPGKQDHATLWMHFAEGLGATRSDVRGVALNPETTALIDTFRRLARTSYAAGLGALYAYESQLPDVASTKIAGLTGYGVSDEQTIRFFRVHEEADREHAAVCRALIDALPADQQRQAQQAAEELADALLGFLSGVERTTGLH